MEATPPPTNPTGNRLCTLNERDGAIRRGTVQPIRLRRFVFTLNNPTEEEYDDLTSKDVTWMVIGKETGENGTPHLQGACILGTQMRFSTLKTWIGLRRAHIEPMYGKPSDSLAYCSKQDSAPFVKGTLPEQGKRNDIHDVVDDIRSGKTIKEIAEKDTQSGVVFVKYSRGLMHLRGVLAAPRDISVPPKIYWLYGPTGCGKTRSAFEAASSISPDNVYITHSAELKWFCGYDGQPCVIFDDFRSKGVKFNFLLRLTDRYPMVVEIKGGSVNWAPAYIFITTPHSIDTTFSTRKTHKPEDVEQLLRRVNQQFNFEYESEQLEFRGLFGLPGINVLPSVVG